MAPTLNSRDIKIDKVFSYKYILFLKYSSNVKTYVANLVQCSSLFRTPEGQELRRRQSEDSSTTIIPTTYHGINDGPSPGVIVGIVLGSIGGILVLFSIFYVCCIQRDCGEFRTSSPALTSRSRRRSTRRNHGTSSKYKRSIAKNERSHRQPRVKVRRPLYAVSTVSASRSIPRSSRYPSRVRDDSFARYPNSERRSYQHNSIPRDSDQIVVIEEPTQSRKSPGGARSRSSRESRRSRDRTGGHSMNLTSSRGVRSSIDRASR